MRLAIKNNLVLRMRNIEVSSLPASEKPALRQIELLQTSLLAPLRRDRGREHHHISEEFAGSLAPRSFDASSAIRQRCSTTRGLMTSSDGRRSRRTRLRRNRASALDGS